MYYTNSLLWLSIKNVISQVLHISIFIDFDSLLLSRFLSIQELAIYGEN